MTNFLSHKPPYTYNYIYNYSSNWKEKPNRIDSFKFYKRTLRSQRSNMQKTWILLSYKIISQQKENP